MFHKYTNDEKNLSKTLAEDFNLKKTAYETLEKEIENTVDEVCKATLVEELDIAKAAMKTAYLKILAFTAEMKVSYSH